MLELEEDGIIKRMKNQKIEKATDFQEYLDMQLKDKNFKRLFDEHGKQLEEGLLDIKEGRVSGPFKNARGMVTSLRK